jgi:chromobox protein 5
MARVEPAGSDSDAGNTSIRTKKKVVSQMKGKASPEVDENNMEDDTEKNSDGGENEEEEYEIEEIMDAKRGTFPGGRLGYLVKWKGYDSSHNSWVDEMDAGNATLLIEAYWAKGKKDKGGRKSVGSKPKPSIGKKSLGKDEGSEVGTTSAVKKRGRPKTKYDKEDTDQEDSDHAPKKKSRKSNGADTKNLKKAGTGKKTSEVAPDNEEQDVDDEITIGNMQQHMKTPSWEHLIAHIETVERTSENELDVFFKLATGESVREDARVCALRFPQKLIAFYESNLRWKISDT